MGLPVFLPENEEGASIGDRYDLLFRPRELGLQWSDSCSKQQTNNKHRDTRSCCLHHVQLLCQVSHPPVLRWLSAPRFPPSRPPRSRDRLRNELGSHFFIQMMQNNINHRNIIYPCVLVFFIFVVIPLFLLFLFLSENTDTGKLLRTEFERTGNIFTFVAGNTRICYKYL